MNNADPSPLRLDTIARAELQRLEDASLLRTRRIVAHPDSTHVEIDGRRLINFASNNYLGLTHHPKVLEAAQCALADGAGSGAAALVSGYTPAHAHAEQQLAQWKGTEAAVITSSGFSANLIAIQTIASLAERAGHAVRFLIDKLSHASLIDAVRSTGAAYRAFPHNHMVKLERLLAEASRDEVQVVVTESVFSMDGDFADLNAVAALKRKYRFTLVLDEAHATGIFGHAGEGLAAEMGVQSAVDVSIATLSKALGGMGGAICGSRAFCDAAVNLGRAYLFSTSTPASIPAAAAAAIEVVKAEPQRRQRVRELARRVRTELNLGAEGDAPIVPIVLGDEASALAASQKVWDEGMWVPAIRPPTVPKGSNRLRVTLCSDHTDQEVDVLINAVNRVRRAP